MNTKDELQKGLKRQIGLIFFLAILIVVLVAVFFLPDQLEHPNCIRTGGVWMSFSNTCADSCDTSPDDVCGQVFTSSCNCLFGCWDGEQCTGE